MRLKALNALLEDTPYELKELDEGLSLLHPDFSPLVVDFLSGKAAYRQARGGGFSETLARACMAKKRPRIFDLTAGLGRDAFVLASLGADVTMFERHPIIFALLCDGLKRLKKENSDICLSLIHKDSLDFLNALSETERPDVIYFDPMHPKRQKSALVKKDLRLLQDIVGPDDDKLEVFAAARQAALKRVVVKWPNLCEPIAPNPDLVLKGKSTHYHIYFAH